MSDTLEQIENRIELWRTLIEDADRDPLGPSLPDLLNSLIADARAAELLAAAAEMEQSRHLLWHGGTRADTGSKRWAEWLRDRVAKSGAGR